MSKMSMPGFNAEFSLYKKSRNYHVGANVILETHTQVVPQRMRVNPRDDDGGFGGSGTWTESVGCWGVIERCHDCGYSGGQIVCGGRYVCGTCFGFW